MDHKLISFCDIKKQARLDQGQFGVVYRAEYNELIVAAKEITPPDTGQEFVQTFRREVEINSQLDHDNVVKFYGACFDPFCIVMEYVTGITRGLKYLHDLKVLHRDLKSKNVLIEEGGGVLSPKLCDFGVSKTLNATMNVNTQEIGTVRWMAPEVMCSNTYNYKCDIYSFGVTIYEILAMDLPYKDVDPYRIMMMKAVEKRPLTLPNCVADSSHQMFVKIFKQCVEYDPTQRPKLLDLLLKLQNADLSSDSDPSLEVDEDTRLAWEFQQEEYENLAIITTADEQYAMELQQRFYQLNIQPHYKRHNTDTSSHRWHGRDYDEGIGFASRYDIDTVQHDNLVGTNTCSSGYLGTASPGSNIEFLYDPPSIQDGIDPLSLSDISNKMESEPELDLLDLTPLSEPTIRPDILTPVKFSPVPAIPEGTPAEKRRLDDMATCSGLVPSDLGSFLLLNSDFKPVPKSPSQDLTPKKKTPMDKFLKLLRSDSRNKSPEPRDRNATFSGNNNKKKTHFEVRTQSCVENNEHDDEQNFSSFHRTTSNHNAT
ncbi:Serine/threonine-protein kinase STY17-like [Oopsacas minuta]|uniref:Serine/threonine-protein kinase STY17-like n=1 Tax=Oopsacas minuta TaxID=111878 RepID=A0AAV7KFT8_9METZ|nr:Serine/threonine-protein kinase STY17-like [Oopsacas minuta]